MSAVLDQSAQPARVTTMESLRRPGAPEASMPVVRMGFNDLQGFELLQRAAKALAASTLVPQQYQGNLPNALIALEMAQRIGASPLMVMQNLYIVHGRPGWSSKFLIASFNQCGRFTAVRFEWLGKRGEDSWGCKAWATERATGEKIEGPTITIQLAKDEGWYSKSGSKWKTIPELMLMYRAAGWMINTHAPEISMGLNTVEEMGDVFDASPGADGQFEVNLGELRQGGAVDANTGEIAAAPSASTDAASTDAAPDAKPRTRKASAPPAAAQKGGFEKSPGTPEAKAKFLSAFAGSSDINVLDIKADEANAYEWTPEALSEINTAYMARREALEGGAA